MESSNCCTKENCTYPIVNKTHKLCQTHNWERTHKGLDYFEYHQNKKIGYAKKMQERALEKAKKTPPKPYLWKPKKPQAPINKISAKMEKSLELYSFAKKEYLKDNPQCEAHFCNCTTPTEELTIHHKMGRIGYENDEKRQQEIPLLLDKDNFMAACMSAHRWIEDNVSQAKKWGYSLNRINEYNR
ncbi:hypothetical protein N9901_01230 [Flavobacteriaceae bacterium]|nr:hypothetical protein [Flavobacteriaceae bacterium]